MGGLAGDGEGAQPFPLPLCAFPMIDMAIIQQNHGNLPYSKHPSWKAGTSPLLTPFPSLSELFSNPALSGFPQVLQPFPEGNDAQSSSAIVSCLPLFIGKGENPSLELEFAPPSASDLGEGISRSLASSWE